MSFGEDPMAALDRLLDATRSGALDAVCEQRNVALLGAFGSAVRRHRDPSARAPRDLDVAVQFAAGPQPLLDLIGDLIDLAGYDGVDVAVLNGANPVLRAAGLTGIGLFERERGAWAIAQMAALAEWRDTKHLRRLDLEALAR